MHVGAVVLLAIAIAIAAGIVSPRWRRWPLRFTVLVVAILVALYAVGRGIAEFCVVGYTNRATYRDDWGGPSWPGCSPYTAAPGYSF